MDALGKHILISEAPKNVSPDGAIGNGLTTMDDIKPVKVQRMGERASLGSLVGLLAGSNGNGRGRAARFGNDSSNVCFLCHNLVQISIKCNMVALQDQSVDLSALPELLQDVEITVQSSIWND